MTGRKARAVVDVDTYMERSVEALACGKESDPGQTERSDRRLLPAFDFFSVV